MKTTYFALILLTILIQSCLSTASHEGGKMLNPGAMKVSAFATGQGVSFGYVNDDGYKVYDEIETVLGLGINYGFNENFELGARTGANASSLVYGKFRGIHGGSFHQAFTFGIGFFNDEEDSESTHFTQLYTGLPLTLELSPYIRINAHPQYNMLFNLGEDFYRSMYGSSFGLSIGKEWGVSFETSYMKIDSEDAAFRSASLGFFINS